MDPWAPQPPRENSTEDRGKGELFFIASQTHSKRFGKRPTSGDGRPISMGVRWEVRWEVRWNVRFKVPGRRWRLPHGNASGHAPFGEGVRGRSDAVAGSMLGLCGGLPSNKHQDRAKRVFCGASQTRSKGFGKRATSPGPQSHALGYVGQTMAYGAYIFDVDVGVW